MTAKNNLIMKKLGLYIHIPFCIKKCNYCDFYSVGCAEPETVKRYVSALCNHIEKESSRYKDYEIDTIFVGGGTPSVLEPKQFEKISKTIKKCLHVSEKAEFSIEANPCSLTKEKLKTYLSCGVNRISIGLQSTDNASLKTLGRLHNFDEFKLKYTLAKEVGFENINIDIMYATPEQTLANIDKTLDGLSEFAPKHISAYCLKIEPGTPFYNAKLNLPNEDTQYEMYMLLCKKLKEMGYSHYEISNFAKEGYECRHNLKYWQREEYVGFGPAAHSFFDGVRYSYESNLQKYITHIEKGILPEKILEEIAENGTTGAQDEYIMLKMRLSKGISDEDFYNLFAKRLNEYSPEINKYIKSGHVLYENGIYRFSDEGFFVSNFILSEILKFN